jgi:hypothetical protein
LFGVVNFFQDVEAFAKEAESVVSDLEKLRQHLTRFRARARISSIEEALSLNREMFDTTKDLAHEVLQAGLFPLPELLRLLGISDANSKRDQVMGFLSVNATSLSYVNFIILLYCYIFRSYGHLQAENI